MGGTEEDWRNLNVKFSLLRKLLAPVESYLRIADYFKAVETVYNNLLKTYQGDPEMAKWWSTVLMDSKEFEYGPSATVPSPVKAYNGWLVYFCKGDPYVNASKLAFGNYRNLSGLSSCPMKIVDVVRNLQDSSTLMGGMLGFKVHQDAPNRVQSLEPVHGWCLLLPEKSPLL
jgi:hypothetical protein